MSAVCLLTTKKEQNLALIVISAKKVAEIGFSFQIFLVDVCGPYEVENI